MRRKARVIFGLGMLALGGAGIACYHAVTSRTAAASKPCHSGQGESSQAGPSSFQNDGQLLEPTVMDEYADWYRPAPGKDFGLRLSAPKESVEVPRELWVHRVTRKVPALDDPASWREWVDRTDARGAVARRMGDQYFFHKKDGLGRSYGVSLYVRQRMIGYGDTRIPSEEDIFAAAKKYSPEQMKAMGETKVKAMGWWPRGLDSAGGRLGVTVGRASSLPEPYNAAVTATYHGRIEGELVAGEGLMLQVMTMATGMVRTLDLRWVETERFRKLPCRTVEDAFAALNSNRAMGLPKATWGSEAHFAGWSYYVGTVHEDHVVPLFKFRLGDAEGGFLAYVPAVRTEFMADPDHQVLSVGEWMAGQKREHSVSTGER